ncbi:MAG: AarF/ABC1/UbiB kinase family protein [Anaerolineae bacterium]|nr:MAG: AarF/ABC1/UbiB kinase family protein [Anaerolineae bacterium]
MSVLIPFRRQYAEIARAREVAEILIKNGLGFVAEQVGLSRFLSIWKRRRVDEATSEVSGLSVAERVRRTLEELGPTFIKIGQVLSGRVDLLPAEYIHELTKLLDAAPPVPELQVVARIEQELEAPLSELFASFELEPIASASIGQVHRATLAGGQKVVVKVQRPDVERTVTADLDLLARQARFLERRSARARESHLVEIVEELSQTLRDELDYTVEGRNADRLRRNLAGDERIIIPRVHWDRSTRRVLTMEALEGLKLTDLSRLRQEGYDLAAVAEVTVDLYLHQVFVDGVFHADPHPANILLCDDRIGLVDFGMMGQLTPAMKRSLSSLLLALLAQDSPEVVRVILRMGATSRTADPAVVQRDVQRLLMRYYGVPLEVVPIGEVLQEVLATAFKHRIHLPPDLALLARLVIVLEGLALRLDPGFNLAEMAKPFGERLLRERVSWRRLQDEALQTVGTAGRLVRDLPLRAESLMERMQDGEVTFGIDLRQLGRIIAKFDSMISRLAFSLVVAALIVGSAVVIHGGATEWNFLGLQLPIAHISFVLAVIMGVWLLISIVRSRGP